MSMIEIKRVESKKDLKTFIRFPETLYKGNAYWVPPLEFDEMNGMCAKCPLSWDKGRGCMGAFGPNNSLLPEIAKKRGCVIVASAIESAAVQKRFSPEDAKTLKKEVETLTAALPEEGKVYVRRYGGVLERLDAVADICVKEGCGFIFF